MAGYRDTLNLPRTDFPMKADLPGREPERLRWWAERGEYQRLREQKRGRPLLILHDGPPYSNAHIHMGTASNKVWKDAVVRSSSLLGFDSPYVPGWDNHGMPIEIQVTKEFREKKLQPDRIELRRRCREYAAEWVAVQRAEFERLGIWGEWSKPYLTMEHAFEAEIVRTFAGLAEAGFVQRGMRSIHWCPTDRTALAEAEIEYQDIPSPSIHVAFPLREDAQGVFAGLSPAVEAVAWTTTPWTLPANLGLMVDPEAPYVVVRHGDRHLLIAAPRLEAVEKVLGSALPEVRRVAGRELLGVLFEAPWGNASRVVDGTPFVSMQDGTGLVHTAPGHGKEDFAVGLREGLGVVNPVDDAGRFELGAEPFVGRSVLDVDADVITWLGERGRLLASGTLTHSYPHCWRCRRPVIFRATRQWFMMIDHHDHRERAMTEVERVKWEPEGARNRIRDAVRLRPDWCLSRQRSWGVGIPALYCESCNAALLEPRVMKRAAELTREHGSDAWFEQPVEAFLPSGFRCPQCEAAGPFRKETDILDVWFDSGSTHRAIQVTHPEFGEAWQRAVREAGRIVYFEGPDQHRGWFNSSLMVGVGLTGHAPYTDVLTHGWVLDRDGRAMHKSLGNVIAPDSIIVRYGADIVRWWALATDWRNDVRVGDEILQRVADAYRKVRNTFRFLLGNLDDFRPEHAVPFARLTPVDRAFASHLAARLERMREDYRNFLFHRVTDALLDVCTVDLSAVFLDVAKNRLYTLAADDPARRSAQTVLWRALHDLAVAASPILVFTAEEVWQSHPGLVATCESVHLSEWPEHTREAVHEGPAGDDWAFLLEIRGIVNAAIEPLRAAKTLATTQEAEVTLTAAPPTIARLAQLGGELLGFLLVARAELIEDLDATDVRVEVQKTSLPRCERCWTHRPDVDDTPGQAALCSRCNRVLAARS
ncbi:MAG: isoleucine--tRNA ligase [Candidatus Eisenbacteria bacterium]|uniref:Isoleucine--tRNA ligase n=1 Tax=Eiseniibacteriota bacterium TaxID=2212470 RepID=A0A849STG1_UNCEI|nr:isoleucine--tRNA ligase [Candidatus Eisenbacteria bacterium]